jgi:hypothetical protein
MQRLVATLTLCAWLSGCATGAGCLAGAGTGMVLGALAVASSSSTTTTSGGVTTTSGHPDSGPIIAGGILLGLACGCVAAEVARVRGHALDEQERREKAEQEGQAPKAEARLEKAHEAPPQRALEPELEAVPRI